MRKLSALAILLISVVSCTTPPDVPVCVDLTETTGWCKYTISEKEQYVDNHLLKLNGKFWDEVKISSLRVPSSSWGKLKEYILAECMRTKRCGDVGKWEKKASAIDQKMFGTTHQ